MTEILERDDELVRLDGLLDSAVAGRGRGVFVGGEPGIGKTSLAARFGELSAAKADVLWGRCDALATPRAMGPLLDVAAALGWTGGGASRDALLGWTLERLRTGRPRILVIVDAHWSDDATVDALAVLGRRAPDLPLLMFVTYRDGEVPADHPLRLVMGDLATSAGAAWITLPRLSPGAVAKLAVDHHDPDALYRLTGGNPFFVVAALAVPPGEVPTSRPRNFATSRSPPTPGTRSSSTVSTSRARARWGSTSCTATASATPCSMRLRLRPSSTSRRPTDH